MKESYKIQAELLNAILRQIELYSSGKKKYPNLVSALGVQISGLMDDQIDLHSRLRANWRVLEEVNALALDENSLSPLNEHQCLVDRTLENIITIANTELEKY